MCWIRFGRDNGPAVRQATEWTNECFVRRSRWPCGLKRGSAAARLQESRICVQLRAWMFVHWVCCVFCRQRFMRRADQASRGVLLCVSVCESMCVFVRDRVCVWVCVRARACVRVCMSVWERARVCESVCMSVCERESVSVCERDRVCVCDWQRVCVWERVCVCVCVQLYLSRTRPDLQCYAEK